MWCEQLHGFEFVLRSVPFLVYGISYADTFMANEIGGELRFGWILKRSGRGTVRIMFKDCTCVEDVKATLKSLDCSIEVVTTTMWAVDVPKSEAGIELDAVLSTYENLGKIDFEHGYAPWLE